jgi:hypothetical protein
VGGSEVNGTVWMIVESDVILAQSKCSPWCFIYQWVPAFLLCLLLIVIM